MFEKKQLDRFSRRDRDVVLDVLKKGVSQLTRLRHPKILSILHPLEDSRFFLRVLHRKWSATVIAFPSVCLPVCDALQLRVNGGLFAESIYTT